MTSPVQARIGMVFVPVSDMGRSVAWYGRLLGVPMAGDIEDIGSLLALTFRDPDGNLLMVCQTKAS